MEPLQHKPILPLWPDLEFLSQKTLFFLLLNLTNYSSIVMPGLLLLHKFPQAVSFPRMNLSFFFFRSHFYYWNFFHCSKKIMCKEVHHMIYNSKEKRQNKCQYWELIKLRYIHMIKYYGALK